MTLKREVEQPIKALSPVVKAVLEGVADGLRQYEEGRRREETFALWVSNALAAILVAVYLVARLG